MNSIVRSFDELPAMLNAKNLMAAFGLSKSSVYTLLHNPHFPSQRFGKRLLVTKTDCLDFLERNKQTNKCELTKIRKEVD